jgi:hypothetical protein
MDLEETADRNYCADEASSNLTDRPNDLEKDEQRIRKSVLACDGE